MALMVGDVPATAQPSKFGEQASGSGLQSPIVPGQVAIEKRRRQGFAFTSWTTNALILGRKANPNMYYDGMIYQDDEHLYGGGLWIGAIVDGVKRVSAAYQEGMTYVHEFDPHPINEYRDSIRVSSILTPGEGNRRGVDDDGDGLTDEDELDGIDNDLDWDSLTDDLGRDGIPDLLESGCNGGYDSLTNPDPAYDNYEPLVTDLCHPIGPGFYRKKNDPTIYAERNGLADHGEPRVDEDFGASSDQDFYITASDTNSGFDHYPLRAGVLQRSSAWKYGSSAEAILVYEYTITNLDTVRTWDSAYVGLFTDPDVGSEGYYWQVNTTGYDTATKTAYVLNSREISSTPLGLTILGSQGLADSGKRTFRRISGWRGLDPMVDSSRYDWIACPDPAGDCIDPGQDPADSGDVRMYHGIGPFTVAPGETIRMTAAFVSGHSLAGMLTNARRAHRIHEADQFIMPRLRVWDAGDGSTLHVAGDSVHRSPWGEIGKVRIYSGTGPGVYTDSLDLEDTSIAFTGLVEGQPYYFAARTIDVDGHLSAISDETSHSPSNIPAAPILRGMTEGEKYLFVYWTGNTEADLAGYRLYRWSSADSSAILLATPGPGDVNYIDTAVWGNRSYHYFLTAVDTAFNESAPSDTLAGRLLPPHPPAGLAPVPGKSSFGLLWRHSWSDWDFAGFNVYRSADSLGGFVRLNDTLLRGTTFIDSTIEPGEEYFYRVTSVDSTDAVSAPSETIRGRTVPMDKGILIVVQPSCILKDSIVAYYHRLFAPYPHVITDSLRYWDTSAVYQVGEYSTVIWLDDWYPPAIPCPRDLLSPSYPIAMKLFALAGGNELWMGAIFPEARSYLDETMQWNGFLHCPPEDIASATGVTGFPELLADTSRLAGVTPPFGSYIYPYSTGGEVIYRLNTHSGDTTLQNQPLGMRAADSTLRLVVIGLPLYLIDSTSASALLAKVLEDFGEVTNIDQGQVAIPAGYALDEAFPNPFNPSTTLRFSLPERTFTSVKIFNLLGEEVCTLADDYFVAGWHEVTWDARDGADRTGGRQAASGVYFCRITAGAYTKTVKLILMR